MRLRIAAHDEQDFENLFSYLPADGLHVLASDAEQLVGHAVVTTAVADYEIACLETERHHGSPYVARILEALLARRGRGVEVAR